MPRALSERAGPCQEEWALVSGVPSGCLQACHCAASLPVLACMALLERLQCLLAVPRFV